MWQVLCPNIEEGSLGSARNLAHGACLLVWGKAAYYPVSKIEDGTEQSHACRHREAACRDHEASSASNLKGVLPPLPSIFSASRLYRSILYVCSHVLSILPCFGCSLVSFLRRVNFLASSASCNSVSSEVSLRQLLAASWK